MRATPNHLHHRSQSRARAGATNGSGGRTSVRLSLSFSKGYSYSYGYGGAGGVSVYSKGFLLIQLFFALSTSWNASIQSNAGKVNAFAFNARKSLPASSSSAWLRYSYHNSHDHMKIHRLLMSQSHEEIQTQITSESTCTAAASHDSMMDVLIHQSIARAKNEHEQQWKYGSSIFGSSSIRIDEHHQSSWNDSNFRSYSVGVGNGGPSESHLKPGSGHLLYETVEPVLSKAECDYYQKMARMTIAKEKQSDSLQLERELTNSDLGEVRLSNLPTETLYKLKTLLVEKLYPLLSNRFGIPVQDLTVYDGLVLGTIAPSISQPVHRDASLLTLNIPLSSPEEFVGGGTYIEGLLEDHNDDDDDSDSDNDENDDMNQNINKKHDGLPIRMERGKALCHSSGIMHAGTSITEGERWVMVLFVICRTMPQIARRTHAEGLDAIKANALDHATAAFQAGLMHDAPHDHLLHMGLGQVASMRGEDQVAFDCLENADRCYPNSYKAAVTMGKIFLLQRRRPRAALRRFDRILDHLKDRDLVDGAWMPLKATAWDVRVSAARCTLMCAEYEYHQMYGGGGKEGENGRTRTMAWSKNMLPIAIDRLRTAMIPVPGNEELEAMLERCEELLALSEVE